VTETTCDWPDCPERGTHTVNLEFPGTARETWHVCRGHDRSLKNQAVASRVRAQPTAAAPNTAVPTTTLTTHIEVATTDTFGLRECARAEVPGGKKDWIAQTTSGDSYTRLLHSWGKRTAKYDRAHDVYREIIELHDGTRIESTGELSHHRD
jgi:hypothetical protein